MRKLWLSSFLLLTLAASAHAGLDLSWNACNQGSPPGTGNVSFSCSDPKFVATLFANFQSPTGTTTFHTLDAVLDFRLDGASLPAFWHLESGGCNAGGAIISQVRPAQCPAATNANPWGVGGGSATPFITAYGPGIGGANHARMAITVARGSSDPTTITTGTNYYAFHIDFVMDNAGTCSGCDQSGEIDWTSCTLYSTGSPDIVITDSGLRSNMVRFNSGPGLTTMVPAHGGDAGVVSGTAYGVRIDPSATIVLKRSGQPDIVGQSPVVAADHKSIAADFDLTGKAQGLWDVVVTNPDLQQASLPGAFKIEQGTAARLWTDISGRSVVRADREARYDLLYGNASNVNWNGLGFISVRVPVDVGSVNVQYGGTTVATLTPNATTGFLGNFGLPLVGATSTGPPYTLRFTPTTTFAGGDITVDLFQSPELPAQSLHPGPVVARLVKTAGEQVGLTWPSLSGGFSSALDDAINTKLLLVLADDSRWSTDPYAEDAMKAAVDQALDALQGSFSSDVASYRSVWNDLKNNHAAQFSTLIDGICRAMASPPAPPSEFPSEPAVKSIRLVASLDPNDKVGPQGVTGAHIVRDDDPLGYEIFFENVETASAPAQEVVVTDPLNTSVMDLSTLSLGPLHFGDHLVIPPPGLSSYNTEVDLRPSKNLLVRIAESLDPVTHRVTCRFRSIDPTTGNPPDDPLVGFLPPNHHPPEGEGSIAFTVSPKSGLSVGSAINNQASIVFDTNPALSTPTWSNSVDNAKPTSQVTQLLDDQSSTAFSVHWQGSDVGSGLSHFTIFVSVNGGPYTAWRTNTTATSDVYPGEAGKTYAFYSVAEDLAGNIENAPPTPDATITVVLGAERHPWRLALEGVRPNPSLGHPLKVLFTLPDRSPATLELIDLAGRRIASRAVGVLGPGNHAVDLSEGVRIAPGIYVVRLGRGTQWLRQRVAVLR